GRSPHPSKRRDVDLRVFLRSAKTSSVCTNISRRYSHAAVRRLGRYCSKIINAPQGRGYKKDSWEKAAHLFGFDHTFNADGHGRCAMRDIVFLRTLDHLRK